MADPIYVDPSVGGAPVVMVDGVCYQLVGRSDEPPGVTSIDASFDVCDDCGACDCSCDSSDPTRCVSTWMVSISGLTAPAVSVGPAVGSGATGWSGTIVSPNGVRLSGCGGNIFCESVHYGCGICGFVYYTFSGSFDDSGTTVFYTDVAGINFSTDGPPCISFERSFSVASPPPLPPPGELFILFSGAVAASCTISVSQGARAGTPYTGTVVITPG